MSNVNRTMRQIDAPNKAKIQMIVPNDVTPPSMARDKRSATPNLLSAEMWLLQGGGVKNGSAQNAAVASTSSSSKTSKSPSQSTIPIQGRSLHQPHDRHKNQPPIQQRGRNLNHRSPSKRSSSSEVHHHHNNHTTSTSPPTFVVSEHPTSIVSPSNQRIKPTRPQKVTTHIGVTTPSKRPTNIVVPSSPVCPIPSIYILHIRKAFGGAGGTSSSNHKSNSSSHRPIDLYTEVLGLPHQQHPYTDTQIRVAYFRQGRLVLQEQQQCDVKQHQSSSPNSTIIHDQEVNMNMMPSKQRFQAITKAYEIVTNPYYKEYYETHGLPPLKLDAPALADVTPHEHPKREPIVGNNTSSITQSSRRIDPIVNDRNDMDDTDCMIQPKVMDDGDDDYDDIGSVVSIGSILRSSSNDKHRHRQRSKSWGPVASLSRQRVVWKEEVQELIFQPDPPSNQSIEIMEQQQQRQALDSQSNPTSKHNFSGTTLPTEMNRHQQDIEDHDFLDDLEASVDGIGATIGNFVKYLSEHDVSNHTIEVKDDDENDFIYNEQNHVPRTKSAKKTNDDVQLERQLFKENNKEKSSETIDINEISPIPSDDGGGAYAKRIAEYHRRSHSCDNRTSFRRERCISIATTSTAPLKEGKTDQEPRKKPKKSKRKKKCGVDKVPSNMTDIDNGTNDEFCFDPFQHSIDDSIDFGAVDPLIDAWKTPATSNDCCVYDPISPTNNTVHSNSKFDAYELPEVSSILASLDGAPQEPRSIDLDVEKSLSFDDALNRTTDATTKGYIRLDRRANSLSAVMDNRVSSLDVSEITYSSNVSDDPAGRHFHFAFLTSMAQSAKATIKEIASFDEENDDKVETGKYKNGAATALKTQNQSTPKSNDATDQTKDVDILSQFNTFMISFVEDMNKLGTQLSTNLLETNRAVRDTMTFPDAEVSGFLERIGTGLNFSKSVDRTDGDLHQSFTY